MDNTTYIDHPDYLDAMLADEEQRVIDAYREEQRLAVNSDHHWGCHPADPDRSDDTDTCPSCDWERLQDQYPG